MKATRGPVISLDKEAAEKLYELAGGPEEAERFVSEAISRLYQKRLLLGKDPTLDELIHLPEDRRELVKLYKENLAVLQKRLNAMAMTQEELMATIDQLRDTTSSLNKAARDHRLH